MNSPFVWQPPHISSEEMPGLLSGMRLAVKDLFHLSGVATAAGNPDFLNTHSVPTNTSPVVQSLIEAGSTLVGKTITDEIAYSLNGINVHYPELQNPRAPGRLPGGSSSGSAVAVASDLADIGLGTDTGGSIRVPASYQGLFGLRPTHDVISTEHMVALAPSFDTVGWMTRDLNTLSRVANVLLTSEKTTSSKSLVMLAQDSVDAEHYHDIIAFFEHKKINFEVLSLPDNLLETGGNTFRILQGWEIWQQHGNWINQEQPVFAQDISERLNWCTTITQVQYQTALQAQQEFCAWFKPVLDRFIVVLPTTPGPAPLCSTEAPDLAHYRNHLLGMTSIAGLTGCPQLHVPLNGQSLPVGFSLLTEKHGENTLIQTARHLMESAI